MVILSLTAAVEVMELSNFQGRKVDGDITAECSARRKL